MSSQLRLASEHIELVLLPEVGARIHRLRAFGIDVLRTPDDPAEHERQPFYWGAYPMLPWGGRVGTQPLTIHGRTVALPANRPDGWAIHGQAYAVPWNQVGDSTFRFSGGGMGWPWRYEAELTYGLGSASISVDLVLTNVDQAPMPAGLGIHPWFRGPVVLRVPALRAYDDNDASSAQSSPVSGPYDLREPVELAIGLDTTWTELTENRIDLRWPQSGLRAGLTAVTAARLVIVAAHLAEIPDAVAVEPQTHAPQGLRRLLRGEPDALAALDPGRSLRLKTTIDFSR